MPALTQHEVLENSFITLANGQRLAARIWIPKVSDKVRLPAVLEYLPYRKRDGTAPRDESTYPVFAEAGIVGVRVDITGHGESDGEFDDEYSPRELAHGIEVINWIAAQPWSNGKVGMMGISWGGFNGLQLAALHPEPLKAVISISSTVDRYNDDIHYKNGCQLYSNFSWANIMLLYGSRPPDPELREDWEALWKLRLETQPWLMEPWLEHQTRDDYWAHGSIGEDYSNYTVPTLIIGGWADLYHNAPPALLANSAGVCKAINGPWIHKYPHFAWPKPRMDFHDEAIRWWKHWLADEDHNVDSLPAYRAYLSEDVVPGGRRDTEAGKWVAAQTWPPENPQSTTLYLHHTGGLAAQPADEATLNLSSPEDCGISCGEIFSLAPDSDLAGDQRIDQGGSLVFESAQLDEPLSLLGRPEFTVPVSIDQRNGNLCVRLIDIHPDGTAYRVSWGVLNLSHRNDNKNPLPMVPNQVEQVAITLNECGYTFLAGHKIQIALSTAYWPAILPTAHRVVATVTLGAQSSVTLPIASMVEEISMPEPADESPLPNYPQHTRDSKKRWVEKDFQAGLTHYKVFEDSGEEELPHGLRTRHQRNECWSIAPNNPLSSKAIGTHTWWTSRGDWQAKTQTVTQMSCDADNFYLTASVKAWKGDELFHDREWEKTIPRDFM